MFLSSLYAADRFGRKPVILAASFVFAIGSIVMGAADGKEVSYNQSLLIINFKFLYGAPRIYVTS